MKEMLARAYAARTAAEGFLPDSGQEAALERLARLGEVILRHRPGAAWLARFRRPNMPALHGLYLWGPVGRGKSMLMDLFFDVLPEPKKRRLHFHEFMREIHHRLDAARNRGAADALAPVAREIARGARLLCLDEMEVKDIADAMILARLFEALAREGVFIVTTSNRPPADLYKDGLNRALFLPFIDALERHFDIVELAGPQDYRRLWHSGARAWIAPDTPEATHRLDGLWDLLTGGATGAPLALRHAGREIGLPRWHGRIGRTPFDALCRQPLGAGDYLAIAGHLDFLVIDHVPRLGAADAAAARRFINLIDVLHDRGIRLAASAAEEPERLIAPGSKEAFEFARTVSRIRALEGPDARLLARRHEAVQEGATPEAAIPCD